MTQRLHKKITLKDKKGRLYKMKGKREAKTPVGKKIAVGTGVAAAVAAVVTALVKKHRTQET